jgi:DNA uptake protein ComE-like DNA-binding protein
MMNGRKIILSLIILTHLTIGVLYSQDTTKTLENLLDLNNATFEEISRLPIPVELAEKIYTRILYQGPLASVYELNQIEGMNPEIFLSIKPLVRIEPYIPQTGREERLEDLYYRLSRWEGDEGVSQSLVDLWIERSLEPFDINQIRYADLINLQNVSPVDAAAIVSYRNQVGTIYSERDLRSTPFISYYGYRNTRDFVTFEPVSKHKEFHGHILTRMDNTPFMTEEAEATAQIPASQITNNYPNVYTRFFGSIGPNIKFGYSYYHALNEPYAYQDIGFMQVPKAKLWIGFENQNLGPLQIRKLYLGNYALAFGQGIVMENTDFFQPRKSGYGWRKRFIGLSGDNTRNRQYKLTGIATELGYGNSHLFLFGAFDKRDAILNTESVLIDGEVHHPLNQLIVLDQRFEYAPIDSLRFNLGLPWRDNFSELLYGAHFAYDVWPATQLGLTYYESAYDRLLRPRMDEIVAPENIDNISLADNEIFNAYGGSVSDGKNPIWSAAKSFRRVYGFDFHTVYRNLAIQGEYAELDKAKGIFKGNPHALVLNAYIQYNSFYLLGLYRDYSLEFDNPYQRSFSNYRRYKRTIYEDYFYLQDLQYGQLYTNNPQPQAERGFYLMSRYQVNRQFVLRVEYDNWRRVADDATQYRLVGVLEYRPIFPLRINLRQKWQGREVQNNLTTEYFENLEFRGRLIMRLSRYDQLGILYLNAVTKFRPRPRFLFPVEPGDPVNVNGNVASPGEALGGFFTHNFNEWLRFTGYLGYYKGFFWAFEDTQFMVMDSFRGAMRFWISLYTRVSQQISVRMKYTRDYKKGINYIQTRDSDNTPISVENGRYYQGWLFQPSEDFYYLELNLHF